VRLKNVSERMNSRNIRLRVRKTIYPCMRVTRTNNEKET